MPENCYRCGGELLDDYEARDGRSAFCSHCGAPQLLLSEYSESISTGEEASQLAAGVSSGALPPPRPNQIDWRAALRSAAIVAAVAAVLSVVAARVPTLVGLSMVWVVSGSLTTLALYQRRRPLAAMNAGVGARIGALVGILLVFIMGATLSAGMLVARYGLHNMADFDAKSVEAMKAVKVRMAEMGTERPVPPEITQMIDSVEFRTTMELTGYGIGLTGILLVSIFGGTVGGLLRTRRLSPKV